MRLDPRRVGEPCRRPASDVLAHLTAQRFSRNLIDQLSRWVGPGQHNSLSAHDPADDVRVVVLRANQRPRAVVQEQQRLARPLAPAPSPPAGRNLRGDVPKAVESRDGGVQRIKRGYPGIREPRHGYDQEIDVAVLVELTSANEPCKYAPTKLSWSRSRTRGTKWPRTAFERRIGRRRQDNRVITSSPATPAARLDRLLREWFLDRRTRDQRPIKSTRMLLQSFWDGRLTLRSRGLNLPKET